MSTQPKATVAKRGNNNFAGRGDGRNLGLRKIHKCRLTQETALKKKEILPYKNKYDCIPKLTCRIRTGQLGIKNFAQQCIYMSETEVCMWWDFRKTSNTNHVSLVVKAQKNSLQKCSVSKKASTGGGQVSQVLGKHPSWQGASAAEGPGAFLE